MIQLKSRFKSLFANLVAIFINSVGLSSCIEPATTNESIGYIIGRESCSPDSTKNAWLISFTQPPFFDAEKVQDSVIYQGRVYHRVVRTYAPVQASCLKKSRTQNGFDYCSFRFKTILPKRFACDSSKSFNIPEITEVIGAY